MISRHYINEKTKIIPITKNLSTPMKETKFKREYSLKENFFDPSKSSPPNEFMIKLHMRMNIYNKNYLDNNNDDSLDKA
jgi:hypothetical protein